MYLWDVNRSGKLPTSFFISPFVSTSPPTGSEEIQLNICKNPSSFGFFLQPKFKWRGFMRKKKLHARLLKLLHTTTEVEFFLFLRNCFRIFREICIHPWECMYMFKWKMEHEKLGELMLLCTCHVFPLKAFPFEALKPF